MVTVAFLHSVVADSFFIYPYFQEKNPLYQAAKTTFENPTYAGGRQ